VAFAPFILGSPHCLHEPNLALCLLLHLSMVVEACRKRRGPVDERPSRSCCTSITFLFDPAGEPPLYCQFLYRFVFLVFYSFLLLTSNVAELIWAFS
jgi:hypothetical protein